MVRRADSNGARARWVMANSIAALIEVRSANERGASSRRSAKFLADSASLIVVQSMTIRCEVRPDHSTKLSPMRPARPDLIASSTRGSETAVA